MPSGEPSGEPTPVPSGEPRSCFEIMERGLGSTNGMYTISTPGFATTEVYCDLEHNGNPGYSTAGTSEPAKAICLTHASYAGGGWTLIGQAGVGQDVSSMDCSSGTYTDAWDVGDVTNKPANSIKYVMSCAKVNAIRDVSSELGLLGDAPGYWLTTPTSGTGGVLGGAETFGLYSTSAAPCPGTCHSPVFYL